MTSCGADLLANSLMPSLLDGVSFPIPTIDLTDPVYALPAGTGPLYDPITAVGNDALTTKVVDGTGTFDVLMTALNAHLKREYDANRISGAEYSKAYIALSEAALGNATQFLLGRDAARWQAITAQLQARAMEVQLVTERVKLQIAKAQLQAASFEAKNQEAAYALVKMKLATEDITYCTAKFNLDNILPKQLILATEQAESQHAQVSDTKLDGVTPVTGLLGTQKLLYQQQITSYKRDSEVKAAKLFTDAWITQKTIDEGLLPPTNFANASLDVILGALKTNNGFV